MRRRNRFPAPTVAAFLLVSVACSPQAQPLPDDHPAAQIAANVVAAAEFAEEAQAASLPFMCGSGGGPEWHLCLLHANGVTGLVSFGSVEGVTAHIKATGLGNGVVVNLDQTGRVAITRDDGAIEVTLHRGGQTIGSLTSNAFPPPP